MKRILSAILSAAIIAASAAVPASADYTKHDYDIVRLDEVFDNGTATGVDGTKALQVENTPQTKIVTTTADTKTEFLLSFDFRLDSSLEGKEADADGNNPSLIEIPNYKDSGAVNKVGPRLRLRKGQLVTETGSKDTQVQELGECAAQEWYAAEIEGRTVSGASAVFRLYKYSSDGSSRELVKETTGFDMRRLQVENANINGMGATNATIDNVKLISLHPDTLTIIGDDSVDAGQALVLDYGMKRGEVDTIKHAVTWSVYDEAGTTELTSEVSVNENGVLSAGTSAKTQVVTVKASSVFGENTLVGEKKINVTAVDTGNELFDTIAISGDEKVKAGESATFTITSATKGGSPVTVGPDDVVWSVYDGSNVNQYISEKVKITDGVLTVDRNTLSHDVTIRASSVSGKVYGYQKISIEQIGTYIYSNAFETAMEASKIAASVDGSTAYLATEDLTNQFGNHDVTLTEFDVKFAAEGAGVVLKRRDLGVTNSSLVYKNGSISSIGMSVEQDEWYHCELIYSSSMASCNIYKYNEDGTLGERQTFTDIDKGGKDKVGNYAQNGAFTINKGTVIDNLTVSVPSANEITVKAPGAKMFAGETAQFTVTASRNGLPMNASDITWSVLDAGKLPILNNTIKVNSSGLVTASSSASKGTIYVRATAASGDYGEASIEVDVAEIFNVTKLGKNKDGNKIIKIYADKNFYYDDDVTFILTIKDDKGVIKALKTTKTFGDRLKIGENEIPTDLELPADFNPATDKIEVMVWTTF